MGGFWHSRSATAGMFTHAQIGRGRICYILWTKMVWSTWFRSRRRKIGCWTHLLWSGFCSCSASAPCMCERTFSSFHLWCMFGSDHLVATVTVCLHQLLPMDHQRDKKRMQHVSNLINIWCTNSTQFLYMHIFFKYISWLSPSNDMDNNKKNGVGI